MGSIGIKNHCINLFLILVMRSGGAIEGNEGIFSALYRRREPKSEDVESFDGQKP